jgi:hypothetical protein
MIVNRVQLEERVKAYEGISAELGEAGYLRAIRCFKSQGHRVTSTKHFCEECGNYEDCQKYLKEFEVAGGREVEG